eukprot:TRINITY_DN7726_c0_g1_i2.p3 TRINITY_DN7726_c0_g1~~TRINITY_DN7726_c0_g1_i2.p3  ORF type:complete len:137 (+),score=37.68 TRINITY_DN7726_c0_g1_i2:135-545(+)
MCIRDRSKLSVPIPARDLVYVAHETCTKVCATVEVAALRAFYGEDVREVLITSTKGLLGHSMGNCFEDAVAVLALRDRQVCPCVGLDGQNIRPEFADLQFAGSRGLGVGLGKRRYVAHYAAGFGGHYALALYKLNE